MREHTGIIGEMFDKLRRRRRRPAASPVLPPAVATPAVADAAMLDRIDRVRGALVAAGVNLDDLGAAPEPEWFAELRHGQCLPLGPAERQETADHLAGIAVDAVLSDEACTTLLSHIEVLTTLRDLRAEGMDLRSCRGSLPADAATLRSLADSIRGIAAEVDASATVKPGRVA